MIWLVVLVLPATREVLWLHTLGSPLVGIYDQQSWRTSFGREQRFDAFVVAKAKPHYLNARLWRFHCMLETLHEDGVYYNYDAPTLISEAEAIRRDFPNEKWLISLPVNLLRGGINFPRVMDETARISSKDAQQYVAFTRQGARLEPQNALYPLMEASVWYQNGNDNAMWTALYRAAKCPYLDTHDLELASHVVAAHEAIRPLILEEKELVWKSVYGGHNEDSVWLSYGVAKAGDLAHHKGDHERCLAIGVLLAQIGELAQRGNNSYEMAISGSRLKDAAWALAFASPPKNFTGVRVRGKSRDFARYALQHGRGDIARRVPAWAARQTQLSNFWAEKNNYEWWRDGGLIVLLNAAYLIVFWIILSAFLVGSQGTTSLPTQRIWPAFATALFVVAIVLWPIYVLVNFDWHFAMPSDDSLRTAALSVAGLCFFGPPFLLALLGATATLWRNRQHFTRPRRIESEMELSRSQIGVFRYAPIALCWLSMVETCVVWLAWVAWAISGDTSFPFLVWLSDWVGKQTRLVSPVDAMIVPLGYCLCINTLAFLIWFGKWRFFSDGGSLWLTHSGLRRWKESLGIYIILVSLVYLGIGLCGWPARSVANSRIEKLMVQGELP